MEFIVLSCLIYCLNQKYMWKILESIKKSDQLNWDLSNKNEGLNHWPTI